VQDDAMYSTGCSHCTRPPRPASKAQLAEDDEIRHEEIFAAHKVLGRAESVF
jgi:hypothetical protein